MASRMVVATLSPREHTVCLAAAQGHSNKLIAFELELSLSTVATLLGRGLRKLGVTSRVALVRLFGAPPRRGVERLTPSERAIVALLFEGCSYDDIAAQRRRKRSTVARQLSSIYRKLGVCSRAELASVLSLDPHTHSAEETRS